MPDVKWYSGGASGITVGTTTTTAGTANRLLRDDGDSVESSIAQDDGSNITLTAGGLLVSSNDQGALGASGTAFSDMFLASGGVINFNAGEIQAIHTAGATPYLRITGGNVRVATAFMPVNSDGAALGSTETMWSDAFFASGAVLNFNNGDVTLTHSADTLTIGGATLVTISGTGILRVPDASYSIESSSQSSRIGFGVNETGDLTFLAGSANRWYIAPGGTLCSTTDGVLDIGRAASVRPRSLYVSQNIHAASAFVPVGSVAIAQASGYVEIMEQSAPSAGERSSCRLFVDTAAGKRRLMAQFGTGSAILVALEV